MSAIPVPENGGSPLRLTEGEQGGGLDDLLRSLADEGVTPICKEEDEAEAPSLATHLKKLSVEKALPIDSNKTLVNLTAYSGERDFAVQAAKTHKETLGKIGNLSRIKQFTLRHITALLQQSVSLSNLRSVNEAEWRRQIGAINKVITRRIELTGWFARFCLGEFHIHLKTEFGIERVSEIDSNRLVA